MTNEDDLYRQSRRNTGVLGAAFLALLLAAVIGGAAGHGSLGGVLLFVVLGTALVLLLGFAIGLVAWMRSGGTFGIHDVPNWVTGLVGGLALILLAVTVTIVATT